MTTKCHITKILSEHFNFLKILTYNRPFIYHPKMTRKMSADKQLQLSLEVY